MLPALIALLSAACGSTAGFASDPEAARVWLVVAGADDPAEGDLVLRDHLRTGLGHDVMLLDAMSEANLDDVDLVVVSESVSSSAVGSRYRDVEVPVLVLENALFSEMGFAAGDMTRPASDSVHVLLPEAQIAGDVPAGDRQVYTAPDDMKYVTTLAGGGVPVARVASSEDAVVHFKFEEGADLSGGQAAARRVGLGFPAQSYELWSWNAYDLFDASVEWLLGESRPVRERSAMLLRGVEKPRFSERSLRSRLRRQGFEVSVVTDVDLNRYDPDDFDLVVMSKTVHSLTVGAGLRETHTPVLFWEDNQQALPMLATIDDDAQGFTGWHAPESRVRIDPEAPAALSAGFAGPVDFYVRRHEITYAHAAVLTPGAIRVATFGDADDDDRVAIYVVERGARLADGSTARGRRGYFGLYDPTFRLLTLEGIAMFDAMVSWLVTGATLEPGSGAADRP